ncbi:regulatory protein RecX [Microbacterium sp. NPDC019599]|uniref:regulatory protein RecX n=1 Tax=Microbacterium sp. NPDC019599 TaxID=3154690 RepID=UPI00340FEF7E
MREDGGAPEDGAPGLAEELAPVIPLFGRSNPGSVEPPRADGASWNSTWGDDPEPSDERPGAGVRFGVAADEDGGSDESPVVELAEKILLKRLRGRSLSISEARDVLAGAGADAEAADEIIVSFEARGYLDDVALAEQIVHIGVDRKGQGRRVIAQSLAKRGVPRDVADAALLALPDDDRERAMEFARSKARSLSSADPDAALRRLAGQLARRGYGGSLALDVAREALREAGRPRGLGAPGSSGVRFAED